MKDRILSLERCPDGMRGGCFYQKEAPESMPASTPTKRIAHVGKSSKTTNYVVGDAYRNGFGQTVVAPYSVRRRPGAPFSMPLVWSEVRPTLDPSDFNIGNFAQRLKTRDPWQDFFESRQPLADAIKMLKKL